ncbi:RNA polymerase sigma factor [Geodermatophilus sp. URMC 61]|uniref:RNA polymerase sigma factor n=1 Tax=Geodermatophilus sp. URMC 61 TaxID=3423411 RepID=UPI00406C5558
MLVDDDVTHLVTAASRGDQEAWNAIVDRYLPLVYSVTRAYRLGRSDAEDVNQTVWLRLVEHLDHLREPRALPRWLLTTAQHECGRLTRVGRREQPVDPLTDRAIGGAVDDAVVEADLLRAERQQSLRDGLAQLRPADRRLLLLLAEDPPRSYREISELTGMPIGSIGPTRARCLERLRETPAVRALLAGESAVAHTGGDRGEPQASPQRR